ncbi:hypothetical protein B0H11DRAFT_1034997 [Mycena galericulata]|nr:hypothetical protein B0H11DRAFT_1034997 [Mycena galericulata]
MFPRPHCKAGGTNRKVFEPLTYLKIISESTRIHQAVEALKPQAPVTDKKTAFWNTYMKLADEYDKEFQQKYSTDLDTGLIFAGLFSAVSSAFIIQIQPALTSNPLSLVVVSQSLLYLSLFTTLLAALLAVLGKQWLMNYQAAGSLGTIEERGLERQRKLDGLRKWKFDAVLQIYPLLLQLALLLFSIALTLYLWKTNLLIAIIVLALTSFGSASYVFLLGSAIMSPDSPFQTPLVPFLVLVFSTIRGVLNMAWKFTAPVQRFLAPISIKFWDAVGSVCSTWSWVVKSKGYILPRFILHSTRSNNTVPDDPYPPNYFAPPSIEGPAVLWVLETSTDPLVITAAADIAVDLQWSLDMDLTSPRKRLWQTSLSCLTNGNYLGNAWSSMRHPANICGMAYGSLRHSRRPSGNQMFDFPWPLSIRDTETGHIIQIVHGQWPRVTVQSQSWLRWSMHIFPSVVHRNSASLNNNLQNFLDQVQSDTMPNLDDASFANYLCCINSFLSPVDPRLMGQIDKRKFRKQLKIQLFKSLQSTIMDNSVVVQIIHTTAQLQKHVVLQEIYNFDEEPLNLIRVLSEFCCCLSRKPGWLDVIVSAATIASSQFSPGIYSRLRLRERSPEMDSKPLEVDWIYLALQNVQQRWERERNVRDPDDWDTNTTQVVDSLLQALFLSLFYGSPPGTPPPESLHIIVGALSRPGSVSLTAFVVLHQAQSWFLDPTLQPIMQQYPVWSHLGQIAISHQDFHAEYLEMGSNISRICYLEACDLPRSP